MLEVVSALVSSREMFHVFGFWTEMKIMKEEEKSLRRNRSENKFRVNEDIIVIFDYKVWKYFKWVKRQKLSVWK